MKMILWKPVITHSAQHDMNPTQPIEQDQPESNPFIQVQNDFDQLSN